MRPLLLLLQLATASAGLVASLQAKVYGQDTYAKCAGLYRRSADKVCTTSAAAANCTSHKYIWDRTDPDDSRFIYYRNGAWRVTGAQWRDAYVNGSITHGGNFIKSDGEAGEWFGSGWSNANATAELVGQTYDDTHVTTLAGSRLFMHGVGVFEYASVGEIFRSQVYLCPVANCTDEMVQKGDCVTFISAVAVQTSNHTIIFRGGEVNINGVNRIVDKDHKISPQGFTITPVGNTSSWRPRIDHDKMASCGNKGSRVRNCSQGGYILETPDLTLNVAVVGPFEKGWLKEEVSNRTFNVDLAAVRSNGAEVRGIINGDKNGFFQLPGQNANALQPEPWSEVQGHNVVAGAEIFPLAMKVQMDAQCGASMPVRATRMQRAKPREAVFAF